MDKESSRAGDIPNTLASKRQLPRRVPVYKLSHQYSTHQLAASITETICLNTNGDTTYHASSKRAHLGPDSNDETVPRNTAHNGSKAIRSRHVTKHCAQRDASATRKAAARELSDHPALKHDP